jgi:hypothetical protein
MDQERANAMETGRAYWMERAAQLESDLRAAQEESAGLRAALERIDHLATIPEPAVANDLYAIHLIVAAALAATPDSSSITVRWVRQEDEMGCWVAAMAMVTGKTYNEVKAETGDTWSSGGHSWKTDQYLAQHGFAVARYFDSDQFHQLPPSEHGTRFNHKWPDWPMKPFAPLHVCSVQTSRAAHSVVLLSDGTVLDPAIPHPRRLSDYQRVIEIVGVWRVVAALAPTPKPDICSICRGPIINGQWHEHAAE